MSTRQRPDVEAPVVSVAMTTYNHAAYIAQSVESILGQETTFPFELVVGDDCSTDGTREILLDLQRRDPARLRLVLPERNLGEGGKPLFARTLAAVRGRYVATLDGDDYWTDPRKLERQAAFLDAHPDCAMCFHDVLEVADDGQRPPRRVNESTPPEFTGMPEVLRSCFVAACSPMFRREVVCPLPDWYFPLRYGDWPLYVLAAERGRIGYIDEVMGVYRIHAGGMWNGMDRTRQFESLLEFFEQLDAATDRRYTALMRGARAKWHYKLALAYNQSGRRSAALRAGWRALRLAPTSREIDRVRLLKELVFPYYVRLRAAWRQRD